jgi:hypothetical protein
LFIGERIDGCRIDKSGLRTGKGPMTGQELKPLRRGPWRSANAQNQWLSMLVDAIEKVSNPGAGCDRLVLAALSAQLAGPASPYAQCSSRFRN